MSRWKYQFLCNYWSQSSWAQPVFVCVIPSSECCQGVKFFSGKQKKSFFSICFCWLAHYPIFHEKRHVFHGIYRKVGKNKMISTTLIARNFFVKPIPLFCQNTSFSSKLSIVNFFCFNCLLSQKCKLKAITQKLNLNLNLKQLLSLMHQQYLPSWHALKILHLD